MLLSKENLIKLGLYKGNVYKGIEEFQRKAGMENYNTFSDTVITALSKVSEAFFTKTEVYDNLTDLGLLISNDNNNDDDKAIIEIFNKYYLHNERNICD